MSRQCVEKDFGRLIPKQDDSMIPSNPYLRDDLNLWKKRQKEFKNEK